MKTMSWSEMTRMFRDSEKQGNHIVGYVVFTADSFDANYTEEQRTYRVSSNNKAFQEGMIGMSIFADCIDGTDSRVRLDWYIGESWEVEKCYIYGIDD